MGLLDSVKTLIGSWSGKRKLPEWEDDLKEGNRKVLLLII